jgi:hypothetical protein
MTYDAAGHLLTIADTNPAHTVVLVFDAVSPREQDDRRRLRAGLELR